VVYSASKRTEELRVVEDRLAVYLSGKPTDTVNHWILKHVEHIPASGERFTIDGLDILIEKASERRIRLVRLICMENSEKNAEDTVDSGD
jgi:CBS domain containing-hemolysin-like protein